MTPEAFALQLRRLARETPEALRGALAELGARASRQTPGVRVRTGRLRDSVRAEADATGKSYQLRLTASTPYARILEEGGTILPRRGRFLSVRFSDGSWRRPDRVTIRGRGYLAALARNAGADLEAAVIPRLRALGGA